MRHSTIALFGTSTLISVILAACSGDGAVTRDTPNTNSGGSAASVGACSATSASIQTTIFKTSCDGVGCHGSQNPAVGLNLVDTSPDQLGSISSALCPGWSLIVPGSPEKSFLYQKLTATKPACGEAMPLGNHLPDGTAKCIADWISGMATSGGCETCGGSECVALASDAQNCGACGNACPAGIPCENGACSCAGGGQACGGTCVDVQTDAKNCGKCGNACAAGSTCAAGKCSCPTGLDSCGSSCVDVASDAQHCGGCDQACAAKEVCLMGKCSAGCGSLMQCGSSCVDTQSSVLNCGTCGKACAAGLACKSGKCECENGGELCGTACTDTQTDAGNCGACGMKCGAGETCSGGACACNGSGSVSFKNDVAPILAGACTAAGCHSGMKPKENLALDATKSFGELVNVATSECGGARKLVVPGSPGTSYLMQKLLGVDICTGTQMPKAGSSLPQKQLDLISGWICSGAPNN